MNEFVFHDFVIANIPHFESVVEKVDVDKLLLINVLKLYSVTAKKINDLTEVNKRKLYENFQVSTRRHIIQLLKIDDCEIDFIKINKKFSIVNCLNEKEWETKLFEVVLFFRAYGFDWREISEEVKCMINCKLYDSNLSNRYYSYLRSNKHLD